MAESGVLETQTVGRPQPVATVPGRPARFTLQSWDGRTRTYTSRNQSPVGYRLPNVPPSCPTRTRTLIDRSRAGRSAAELQGIAGDRTSHRRGSNPLPPQYQCGAQPNELQRQKAAGTPAVSSPPPESNRLPPHYEWGALPNELGGQRCAPQDGFEPPRTRLTVGRSATELLGNIRRERSSRSRGRRTRTSGLPVPNRTRYQAAPYPGGVWRELNPLAPDSHSGRSPLCVQTQCPQRESNPHYPDFESGASANWATRALKMRGVAFYDRAAI